MERVIFAHKEKEYSISAFRIHNNVNGNPRYVVHFLDLGMESYQTSNLTRKAGIIPYRGKWFGGGFVFSSYSLERDLKRIVEILNS